MNSERRKRETLFLAFISKLNLETFDVHYMAMHCDFYSCENDNFQMKIH